MATKLADLAVDFSVVKSMTPTEEKLGTAELLFRRAQQMSLDPTWVTPDDTFAIQLDGREQYINLARSSLNSDASAALVKDKHVARHILERHGVQNIPFLRPQTHGESYRFLGKYGTIIAKPVNGAGTHDVHIVTSRAQLDELAITDYILEQYITGKEMRYLVLNDTVIAVHHSEYGDSVAYDRPLQRISYPPAAWDDDLIELSLRVADIFGLRFAAVDYLIDDSGKAYVLEVNTMPGLKWFHSPTSGPVVDVARLFLEAHQQGAL